MHDLRRSKKINHCPSARWRCGPNSFYLNFDSRNLIHKSTQASKAELDFVTMQIMRM